MTAAILDHLWQSTLLALGVALLTLLFRKARAEVRHGLWFVASAKFLMPFALLQAVGGLLAPLIQAPASPEPEAAFIAQAAEPFTRSFAPAVQASPHVDLGVVIAVLWALGVAAVLVAWLVRWTRLRAALRSTTPLALPAPMPVLSSASMMEPGLVGLWRPVLLVPDSLFEHLGRAEIDAIVAHEVCHLRRRDNLIALVHMLVEALFWFHPMVWWIGARLIEERERACDEAVVRAGHDRLAYARGLVECCRLYLRSPLACAAGASGSDLKRRVELILDAPTSCRLLVASKALLATAAVCVVAAPVAAGSLASPQIRHVAEQVLVLAAAPVAARVEHVMAVARPSRAQSSGRAAVAAKSPSAPAVDFALSGTDAATVSPAPISPNPAQPGAQLAAQSQPAPAVANRSQDPSPPAAKIQLPTYSADAKPETNCYPVFGRLRCDDLPVARVQTPAGRAVAIAPPAPTQVANRTGSAADPDQVLCRVEPVTGSRFIRHVCLTRDQWRQQRVRLFAMERRYDLDPTGDFALPSD